MLPIVAISLADPTSQNRRCSTTCCGRPCGCGSVGSCAPPLPRRHWSAADGPHPLGCQVICSVLEGSAAAEDGADGGGGWRRLVLVHEGQSLQREQAGDGAGRRPKVEFAGSRGRRGATWVRSARPSRYGRPPGRRGGGCGGVGLGRRARLRACGPHPPAVPRPPRRARSGCGRRLDRDPGASAR